MPGNHKCEVVGIRTHSEKILTASGGENIQLYLKGVSDKNLNPGMVVCGTKEEEIVQPVIEFIGNFLVLEKNLFAAGYTATCHVHTAFERVTVTSLIQKLNKKTGEPEPGKPKFGKTGEVLIAKFKFDNPVCVEKFENVKALGRFTLREDATIAVGKIMKIKPMKKIIKK